MFAWSTAKLAVMGAQQVSGVMSNVGDAAAEPAGREGPFAGAAERVASVNALVERIAANAPLPVAATEKTSAPSALLAMTETFAEPARIWEPVYLTADAQEGPAASRDERSRVRTVR